VACVMACGRVVSALEALWVRADVAKASGGPADNPVAASAHARPAAPAAAPTASAARGAARPVLATSGVAWGDDREASTFESPRRALTAAAHTAHTAPPGPGPAGGGSAAQGAGGGPSGVVGGARGGGSGGAPASDAGGQALLPAPSLLHSVTLVADWRVNASLCTYYLPFLSSEHLGHALRRRCRHALRCGDRVALAGCLTLGRARLPARDFRHLRLACGRDACVRLAAEVAALPALRRASAVDALARPRDVHDLLMPALGGAGPVAATATAAAGHAGRRVRVHLSALPQLVPLFMLCVPLFVPLLCSAAPPPHSSPAAVPDHGPLPSASRRATAASATRRLLSLPWTCCPPAW
jgi:hypothetical protein